MNFQGYFNFFVVFFINLLRYNFSNILFEVFSQFQLFISFLYFISALFQLTKLLLKGLEKTVFIRDSINTINISENMFMK